MISSREPNESSVPAETMKLLSTFQQGATDVLDDIHEAPDERRPEAYLDGFLTPSAAANITRVSEQLDDEIDEDHSKIQFRSCHWHKVSN